jgi:hypothetical protein
LTLNSEDAATPKPAPAHVNVHRAASIPIELRRLDRWVAWQWECRDGKWTKPPIDPFDGMPTNATDQRAWMTFDKARELAQRHGDGIGIALGPEHDRTGLVGVDYDNCIDDRGNIDPAVLKIVDALDSYTEYTPSGRGLRTLLWGEKPGGRSRRKGCPIELYDHDRYFTVTGLVMNSRREIFPRQAELNDLYHDLFGPEGKGQTVASMPTAESDEALLEKARKASNGAAFSALHDQGDTSAYGNDHSAADMALMNHLAFWTRNNKPRMERLFSASALGRREKWQRPDYRKSTIDRAVQGCLNTYTSGPPAELDRQPAANRSDPRASDSKAGPGHQVAPSLDVPAFSNYDLVMVIGRDGRQEQVMEPRSIQAITLRLDALAPGWPKRVGETLFIATPEHQPLYLESATRLTAWIDSFARVDWMKGNKFITQERFYEHLRMKVQQFDAIETLPHWPPLPRTYYMHQRVPEPAGLLERLIDFFHPVSPLDRELIKAMFLTLFWGGSPGSRPAFLVTGPDQDLEQGRGVGKTQLSQIPAEELCCGYIDVAPTDSIAEVKTRLLSTESGRLRVVRLDNVKTFRFSWADLEGLITSSEISGRALYVGEGRRPNTLVWMITLNGASLSKDMAQRCVQIKLARPQFEASWENDLREFIRANRWGIIADIRALLEASSPLLHPETRWAAWERDVLGKTIGWARIQTEIKNRQQAVDDDDEEQTLLAQHFTEQLTQRSHDPETQTIFIPSLTAAEWVSDATRTRYPTNRASAFLSGLSIPTLRKGKYKKQRGWIWTGKASQDSEARKLGEPPPWTSNARGSQSRNY